MLSNKDKEIQRLHAGMSFIDFRKGILLAWTINMPLKSDVA